MPLVIPCPSCQAKLKAPETLIGKTVKCPNCQSPIAVKAPASAPPAKTAPAPAKKPAPQNDFAFDDDEPDEKPVKKGAVKKSRDEEDEDDRPAKKKPAARDDDEEDDRPAKKGAIKKGRDDYDDEPPRKAKSRRDEDDDLDEDEDRPKKGKKSKGGPGGSTTEEERSNAFMIYIAAIVGSFIGIGPLGGIIWWVIKRGESKFVDHTGKEYLNLMITNFLIMMLCGLIMGIGVGVGIAAESAIFPLIFCGLGGVIAMGWGMTAFVLSIIAMFKAKGGEWYRYPMIWHLLKV